MSAREAEYLDKVRQRPNDTLARFVLAKDYFDEGRHADAAEQFGELVRQKPDWMKCWIHLGQSLTALGKKDDARGALEQALALAEAQHHDTPAEELRELLAAL